MFDLSDDIREAFLVEFDQFFSILEEEFAKAKDGKVTNNYEVFRAFHTWKGNAALLGYSDFENFAIKYTEHFRPKKDGFSLAEDKGILDSILTELEGFRKTF